MSKNDQQRLKLTFLDMIAWINVDAYENNMTHKKSVCQVLVFVLS